MFRFRRKKKNNEAHDEELASMRREHIKCMAEITALEVKILTRKACWPAWSKYGRSGWYVDDDKCSSQVVRWHPDPMIRFCDKA